jgi:hypothetical protein
VPDAVVDRTVPETDVGIGVGASEEVVVVAVEPRLAVVGDVNVIAGLWTSPDLVDTRLTV